MKTILIDLDGVLNEYRGDFNKDFIPKPRKGVEKFLKKLVKSYELRLFTTRNRLVVAKWLLAHKLDKYFADITNVKELSWLIVDDRCLRFDGDYNLLSEQIENFQPWYKVK